MYLHGLFLVASLSWIVPYAAFANASEKDNANSALRAVSIPFETRSGDVAFQARTPVGPLFVTKDGELVWNLPSGKTSWNIVERFSGGTPKPRGADVSPVRVSEFHGKDSTLWHPSAPTWNQVALGEVWPGVEVSLVARSEGIEKRFVLQPGTDVRKILMSVDGGKLDLKENGQILVATGRGEVSFTAPIAWQEVAGKQLPIQVSYRLEGANYGFNLGNYDHSRPVVIDPLLQSTYLGGGAWYSEIYDLVTTADAVYVVGTTSSWNFPGTAGGAQSGPGGVYDVFVAKLSLDLRTLIQATFLGGSSSDEGSAIIVTKDAVYVAGATFSGDFPGTAGSFQEVLRGSEDVFVTKLSLDLTTLIQSTYLGGSGDEGFVSDEWKLLNHYPGNHLNWFVRLINTQDSIYVSGATSSTDFPGTAKGAQWNFGGDIEDGFVARLSTDLRTMLQSTYLGGSKEDKVYALGATQNGLYAAGLTGSDDFPGTHLGSAQPAFAGGTACDSHDAFVTRLSFDLRRILRSTYLGGATGSDEATTLFAAKNAIYVAGNTCSADFPNTNGGALEVNNGAVQMFIAKFNLDLNVLTQATYLGDRSGNSLAESMIVTPDSVYLAGITMASEFPGLTGGAQTTFMGDYPLNWRMDAFASRLSVDLKHVVQSTLLGGTSYDYVMAIGVTPDSVYAGGFSYSPNFPNTVDGYQEKLAEGALSDSIISRFDLTLTAADNDFVVTNISLTPSAPENGTPFRAEVTVQNQGTVAADAGQLVVWLDQNDPIACNTNDMGNTGGDQFVALGKLNGGETKVLTFENLSPSGVGTKTFRAFVDGRCTTLEKDENNNQATQSYLVTEPVAIPSKQRCNRLANGDQSSKSCLGQRQPRVLTRTRP